MAVAKALGITNTTINPITTAMYPLPAQRLAYSVLSCDKLERAFVLKLPEWQSALADCVKES